MRSAASRCRQSWKDLTEPNYKRHGRLSSIRRARSSVLRPASPINRALGGSLDDFTPGASTGSRRMAKQRRHRAQADRPMRVSCPAKSRSSSTTTSTPTARNTRTRSTPASSFPKEGTLIVPYVMSLVKGAPNAANGKKVLDFLLTDKGQAVFANAFVRPIRPRPRPPRHRPSSCPMPTTQRASGIDFRKVAQVAGRVHQALPGRGSLDPGQAERARRTPSWFAGRKRRTCSLLDPPVVIDLRRLLPAAVRPAPHGELRAAGRRRRLRRGAHGARATSRASSARSCSRWS